MLHPVKYPGHLDKMLFPCNLSSIASAPGGPCRHILLIISVYTLSGAVLGFTELHPSYWPNSKETQ